MPIEKGAKPSKDRLRAEGTARLAFSQLDSDPNMNSAEGTFTNGVRAEIAMCRTEIYLKPGRKPEVSPAAIFEDLRRRDFSMNAMAISLHPNSRGLLLDPTNGAADIERHELRALYRGSFAEDPSRIFRLLRFGLRLNFKPEERTKAWLDSALENGVTTLIGPEQQGRELRSILEEENPIRILRLLAERGLLADLDEKLASTKIPYDRLGSIRGKAASFAAKDAFVLFFYGLTEKLGGAHRTRLAKKILQDARISKQVLTLERDAKKLAKILGSSKASLPSHIYTLLSKQPRHLLLFLLTYYLQSKIQSRLKSYLFKFPQIRARLPRAELHALGVKPGPELENILEHVFLEELDGKIKSPTQVTKRLKELAGIKDEPPKAPPAKTRGRHPKTK